MVPFTYESTIPDTMTVLKDEWLGRCPAKQYADKVIVEVCGEIRYKVYAWRGQVFRLRLVYDKQHKWYGTAVQHIHMKKAKSNSPSINRYGMLVIAANPGRWEPGSFKLGKWSLYSYNPAQRSNYFSSLKGFYEESIALGPTDTWKLTKPLSGVHKERAELNYIVDKL